MKRKRRGSPTTEDDAGNGNHQSSSHSKEIRKGNAIGTHIEAAQDDGPLRVATTTAEEEEEEDKTARALLTEEGFDPNDLKKRHAYGWTPLTYFSYKGNIAMIRYLTARGADCRKTDMFERFPLYVAAMEGHVEIVQFLSNECGAHEDIRRVNCYGKSPLDVALNFGNDDTVQWLTLNGALSPPRDDVTGGDMDDMAMRRDLRPYNEWVHDKRLPVLSWARDAVATHDTVVELLLTGMIVRSNQTSSALEVFKGTSGILELIAHFVVGTPKQVRTLRQLIDRLPAFIADVPFFVEEEEEDEDDEDDY